MFNQMAKSL